MTRILILCFVWAAVSGCAAKGTRNVLEQYVGTNLRSLPPSRIEPLLEAIGKQEKSSFVLRTSPWYVWRIREGTETRYAVLEEQDLRMVPQDMLAKIHLFDDVGTKIKT